MTYSQTHTLAAHRTRDFKNEMSQRTRAFTLLELLVVMAIIAVLVALLLPAVQAARAAARRTSCTNNLKQMGIAIHSYTELHKCLPPGYISIWSDYFRREEGPGWGWASMILSQLEQGAVFNNINFDVAIQMPQNLTMRIQPIDMYLCPADNMPKVWTTTEGVAWVYAGEIFSSFQPICDVAGANYVGVFGIGEPGVDGDGVFFRNSSIRWVEITDGLTNTMLVGERSLHLNAGRGHATWVGSVPGATLWSCAPDPFDPDAGVCRREDGSGMTLGHTGEGNGPGALMGDVNQFLSRHGMGAHFLFGDGHVRYLDNSIYYPVYKALSTRSANEQVDLY
jgi:prepilin-type N-terminal cleavage/methylation domain-containing protein/prepilin-type processing-associated H-X9-DG protein